MIVLEHMPGKMHNMSPTKYKSVTNVSTVQEHLNEVLPAILDGLADESEGVREAALSAGRTAVELFAQTSLPLLLPAVEAGIINDNWRIRQSSVELLGDLLFKVLGAGYIAEPPFTSLED